ARQSTYVTSASPKQVNGAAAMMWVDGSPLNRALSNRHSARGDYRRREGAPLRHELLTLFGGCPPSHRALGSVVDEVGECSESRREDLHAPWTGHRGYLAAHQRDIRGDGERRR